MSIREFIPVIECVLRCADQRIIEVSLKPSNEQVLRIYVDDSSIIEVNIRDKPLLQILVLAVNSCVLELDT